MRYCIFCGVEIPSDAQYCQMCGKQQPEDTCEKVKEKKKLSPKKMILIGAGIFVLLLAVLTGAMMMMMGE